MSERNFREADGYRERYESGFFVVFVDDVEQCKKASNPFRGISVTVDGNMRIFLHNSPHSWYWDQNHIDPRNVICAFCAKSRIIGDKRVVFHEDGVMSRASTAQELSEIYNIPLDEAKDMQQVIAEKIMAAVA